MSPRLWINQWKWATNVKNQGWGIRTPDETINGQQGDTVTGVTTSLRLGQLPFHTCDPRIITSSPSRSPSIPVWTIHWYGHPNNEVLGLLSRNSHYNIRVDKLTGDIQPAPASVQLTRWKKIFFYVFLMTGKINAKQKNILGHVKIIGESGFSIH